MRNASRLGCIAVAPTAAVVLLVLWTATACAADRYSTDQTATVRPAGHSSSKSTSFFGALKSTFSHMTGSSSSRSGSGATHGSPKVRRFDELNVEMDVPGRPWVEVNEKDASPDTCVTYVRARPDVCVTLTANRVGTAANVDVESLVALGKARLQSQYPDARFSEAVPHTAMGIEGRLMEVSVTAQGQTAYIVGWMGAHNGYTYSLGAFGPVQSAAASREACHQFLRRLRKIDPNRVVATGEGKLVGRFESPQYGYRVDLTDMGWVVGPDAESPESLFDFSAQNGNASIGIIPVPMPGCCCEIESLARIFFAQIGIDLSGPDIVRITRYRSGTLGGQQFDADRHVGSLRQRTRMRVVGDERCAYVIAGVALGDDESTWTQVQQALDKVTVVPRDLPKNLRLSDQQKQAISVLYNVWGLAAYNRGRPDEAAEFFSASIDMDSSSPLAIANYARVLVELNRSATAQVLLEQYMPAFPDNLPLRALYAHVRAERGDIDAARSQYHELFAHGYTDEMALLNYSALCVDAGDYSAAIFAAEQMCQRKPTLGVRIMLAALYARKGDMNRAIEVLQALREEYPAQTQVGVLLANAYAEEGQYEKAIEVTGTLLNSGARDEATLVAHGTTQLHLERFSAAKETFEQALKVNPASEEAKTLLALASSRLGEGDNSPLKTRIEPVEVPDVVRVAMNRKSAATSSAADQPDAEELVRIMGIAYHEGEPLRSTIYRRIKIHTAAGVSQYRTLTFTVDPTAERLFVNDLALLDANGKKVAEGSVDNYYLMDDQSSGTVSRAKRATIPVPSLQPGYTLEVRVTRQSFASPQGGLLQKFVMSSGVPVGKSVFFITGDVDGLKCATSTPIKVQSAAGVRYCVQDNLPAYRHEKQQLSADRFLPTIWVGQTGHTWDQFAKDYLELIDSRLVLDDQTRAVATDLTRRCRSQREKLAVLAAYVQQNYTYQGIEFGCRGRVPNTCAQTRQLRYGDCKDHAVLLRQLLLSVGIPAQLAVVNTSGLVVPELPSLDQFDHMIVYVPAKSVGVADNPIGGLLVDGTEKDADPLLFPPCGLADKEVLVLDPQAPKLVHTPDYPADAARVTSRRSIQLRVDPTGSGAVEAHVEETLTLNQYAAPGLRAFLRQLDSGQRRDKLQLVLSQSEHTQITRLDIENLSEPTKPLVMKLAYVHPDIFQRIPSPAGGYDWIGRLPSLWERFFLEADFDQSRETPFRISMPMYVESTMNIELPSAEHVADLERCSGEGQSRFTAWVAQSKQEQSHVRVEYRARLGAGRFAASDYPQYYADMKRALSIFRVPTALREQATGPANRPATTTVR